MIGKHIFIKKRFGLEKGPILPESTDFAFTKDSLFNKKTGERYPTFSDQEFVLKGAIEIPENKTELSNLHQYFGLNLNQNDDKLQRSIGNCFRQNIKFGETDYKSHNLGAFVHEKSEKDTRVTHDTDKIYSTSNNDESTSKSKLTYNMTDLDKKFQDNQIFGFVPIIPTTNSYEPFSLCGALMPPNFSKNSQKNENEDSIDKNSMKKIFKQNEPSSLFCPEDAQNDWQPLSNSDQKIKTTSQKKPVFQFSKLLDTLNLDFSGNLDSFHKTQKPIKKMDFWEDLGPSRRVLKELPMSGIFNKERTKKFFKYYDDYMKNLFSREKFLVSEFYIKKNQNLMLMGIEADLFKINPTADEFYLNKENCALPYQSSLTLTVYLQELIPYGTKVYRLEKLRKSLQSKNLSESFTHKVLLYILEKYIDFFNQQLYDKDKEGSLLDYVLKIKNSLGEIDQIYEIFFAQYSYSPDIENKVKIATDTENLDHLFKLLKGLYKHYNAVNVVNYIMALALRPIIKTLEDIIFKTPDISKLYSNLKISIDKDASFDFVVKNVPVILKKCIINILISAQNLTIIRSSDTELFAACIHGEMSLSQCFTEQKMEAYLTNLKKMFIDKKNKISDQFIKYKNEDEAKKLAEITRRTIKLRLNCEEFQAQEDQIKKVKEMKRFLNNQIQDYLLDQIKESKINNYYIKELEKEYEKKLQYDQEWIRIQKEKEQLKEEVARMGADVEAQIMQLYENKENVEKEIINEMKLIEEEERRIADEIYEKNRNKKKLARNENSETPNNNTANMNEEQTYKIHSVNLWKKRIGEKKVEQGNLTKELTDVNKAAKIQNKWSSHERKLELELLEEKEEINNLAFDIHTPPISVIFDLCINKAIETQANLTSKVLLELLFDRYKMFNMQKYFKTVFLTERGDLSDQLAENLYDFSSNLNINCLLNINFLFQEFEKIDTISLPYNIKFEIIVEKKQGLGERSALNTALNDIASLTTNIPYPLYYLFSPQIIKLYFELFSYFLRLRHIALLLKNVWKIQTKELKDSEIETINLNRLLMLRNSLHDFMSRLQGYIYFFVIESAWKVLVRRLEKVKTFSNVFKYHYDYLKAIGEGAFVFQKKKNRYDLVISVMSVISDLSGIVNYLKIGMDYGDDENSLENRLFKLEQKFEKCKVSLEYIMNKNMEITDMQGIFQE